MCPFYSPCLNSMVNISHYLSVILYDESRIFKQDLWFGMFFNSHLSTCVSPTKLAFHIHCLTSTYMKVMCLLLPKACSISLTISSTDSPTKTNTRTKNMDHDIAAWVCSYVVLLFAPTASHDPLTIYIYIFLISQM